MYNDKCLKLFFDPIRLKQVTLVLRLLLVLICDKNIDAYLPVSVSSMLSKERNVELLLLYYSLKTPLRLVQVTIFKTSLKLR